MNSVGLLDRLQLLDAGGDHLGEAASPGSAPVEATDELAVHQDVVALGDRLSTRLPTSLCQTAMGRGRRRFPASGTESRSSVSPDSLKGA